MLDCAFIVEVPKSIKPKAPIIEIKIAFLIMVLFKNGAEKITINIHDEEFI
jgi:hypothetical protein